MEILSITNSKLRLHTSPFDLSVICEYSQPQKDDEYSDFITTPIPKSFLQFTKNSKQSSINLLRIKEQNGKDIFELINKTKGENISSVSFCKNGKYGFNYSAGYISGKVKTFDVKNKIISEFSAPTSASSAIFLDYNATDENLACVFENGSVNIFGMQTTVKTDSFDLDKESTLARFHPSKRSHLAIASYNGGVTVLDIFAKKAIFKSSDAHSAPCSDVFMTEDLLLSSGYDTIIRLFDLRKKSLGLQIKGSYGWTTIANSKCGAYFIGGNMKGELISYDMRHIKKPLANIRIENAHHKITRVAFIVNENNSTTAASIDISKAIRQSLCKFEEEIGDKVVNNESFIEDIVMFQRGRISDFSSNINIAPRVSTSSSPSQRSSNESPGRFQDVLGRNKQNVLLAISPASSPSCGMVDDSRVNKNRRLSIRPHKSQMSSVLHEINEEMLNEKENIPNMRTPTSIDIKGPRFSSTPTFVTTAPLDDDAKSEKEDEVIEIDDSFKSAQHEDLQKSTITNVSVPGNFDLRKEFDALAEKIRFEVQSMNMDENMRHIQLVSHVIEQRNKLQERIQLIEETFALLLNDDFKINRILELQSENDQLRQQLSEIIRRTSP